MSEAAPETPATETVVEETKTEVKPEIDWKAKAREWEKRAKENSDAAAKLAALEESQKTEAQKLADRLAEAEKAKSDAEREVMRMRVIAEFQLDPDLHEFVVGDTEDEMRAKAAKLKARETPTTQPGPRPDLSQGASSSVALNDDALTQSIKSIFGAR